MRGGGKAHAGGTGLQNGHGKANPMATLSSSQTQALSNHLLERERGGSVPFALKGSSSEQLLAEGSIKLRIHARSTGYMMWPAKGTGIAFPTAVSTAASERARRELGTIPAALHFSSRLRNRPLGPNQATQQGEGRIQRCEQFVRKHLVPPSRVLESVLPRGSRATSTMPTVDPSDTDAL